MSTILKEEAKLFARPFTQKANSIRQAKELLEQKLVSIKLDRHKLDFLHVLRMEVDAKGIHHKADCRNPTCTMDRNYEASLFVVDQEIESIAENYTPKIPNADRFTMEEKITLHNNINTFHEKLNNLGLGQQIIFEEIESLKEHFDLGKKNWFQLLKGKLVDMVAQSLIEKAIIPMAFQTITASLKVDYFKLPE